MDTPEKPTFSQVIGAIVSSVAHARSVADAEALRIAYLYRNNEFLKGLPVPRLRVRRVNISLPVIVSGTTPEKLASPNTPELIAEAASKALHKSIESLGHDLSFISRMDSLPPEEKEYAQLVANIISELVQKKEIHNFSSQLKNGIHAEMLHIDRPNSLAQSNEVQFRTTIGTLAAEVAWDCISQDIFTIIKKWIEADATRTFDPKRARLTLEKLRADEDIRELLDGIRQAAAGATYASPSTPPELHVLVDTDAIKNSGGGPDIVTRFNMTLLEEGLEWVTDKQSGTEKLGIE